MSTRSATRFMAGAMRVFELSLGEMLWSRRTIFMGLVVGSPVLIALVARIVRASGFAPMRVNGAAVDALSAFGTMVWMPFLWFVIPVLGVFYGTSMIADEVEDKTITYLFTRPVRRGAVFMGKYLAYLVCTWLVVLPSVVLVYFLLVPFPEVGAGFRSLLIDLGLLAIGLAAYGALFGLVGTIMKRPLVVGLVFAFGWEQVALFMPGYLKRFTLAFYLHTLAPHAMPSSGSAVSLLQAAFFSEAPSVAVSLLALAGISAASLFLAGRAVEQKEYVLEQ